MVQEITGYKYLTDLTNFSTARQAIVQDYYWFTWNGAAGSAGNTTFNIPFTGRYRVTVNDALLGPSKRNNS